MGRELFLIDGHAHCYQAFYAIRGLSGPDGEPVGAVYGFARMLERIRRQYRPEYLAVVFDPPGKVFRHEMYDDYKATRKPTPDELLRQWPVIHEMLEAQDMQTLVVENYEADDVMASAAALAASQGVPSVLVTTDKDANQLIDDMTRVLHLHKNKEAWLDAASLKERYGLEPSQVVDYMALMGDSSDNVPGAPGVGPKTAAELIGQFGSVENLYDHLDQVKSDSLRERLAANREQVELSRRLVVIERTVPLEFGLEACRTDRGARGRLNEFYRALGFGSLIEDETEAAAPAPAEQTALFDTNETGAAPAALENIRSVSTSYRTVRELEEVRELAAKLPQVAPFSLDLETTSLEPHEAAIVGIALSWQPRQGVYVATAGPAGEKVCAATEALAALKPAIEDPAIGKVGQNLKYDMLVLKNHGVELRGIVCDAMIASYLLNPSDRSHGLDALARRHLGYECKPITDLIGKGRDQISMDMVPVERAGEYACEDADVAFQLSQTLMGELSEQELLPLLRDLELPLIPVLAEMEWRGVKVDEARLERVSEEFQADLEQLAEEIYGQAGREFNINSPKQLSQILFEEMELPRPRGKERTTGYSTNSDVLEALAAQHEIARRLLRWRELSKLKGTYADALHALINRRTGRVHTSFNQTGTATGRLSSSEPNLQNIPVRTPLGRRIRSAFVPGEDGMSLLSADYSQVELRVLAHCSGDRTLREAFRQDRDIHRFVAAQVHDVPEDEVTPLMRQQAKAVNFGIVYGQRAYGLSRQIGVPVAEAQRFINGYFERYPRVKRFIGETIARTREDGYVKTVAGRRRRITGIRSSGSVRGAAERMAVNTVIQGSAADLMKSAMIEIGAGLREVSPRSAMLLQIHDELVFEVPDGEIERVRQFVVEKMSGAMESLCPGRSLEVPLKVDTAVGKNWEEAK